jgi:hypothetical protein
MVLKCQLGRSMHDGKKGIRSNNKQRTLGEHWQALRLRNQFINSGARAFDNDPVSHPSELQIYPDQTLPPLHFALIYNTVYLFSNVV